MEASMKQRRNSSPIRIIAPVSKFGIQMPLAVSPAGYRVLAKLPRHHQLAATTVKPSILKLVLLRILASLCPEFKGHRSIETASKRAQGMPAITPQEFLF